MCPKVWSPNSGLTRLPAPLRLTAPVSVDTVDNVDADVYMRMRLGVAAVPPLFMAIAIVPWLSPLPLPSTHSHVLSEHPCC